MNFFHFQSPFFPAKAANSYVFPFFYSGSRLRAMFSLIRSREKNDCTTKDMEEIQMKPTVKEFYNDQELISEVEKLSSQGIDKKNLYVLSHDDDRTERVADNANANEIGAKETGIGTAVGNMILSKGDELRNQLQEMGFSKKEADHYEEKMDEGKILLLVQN
jgi:hypothetical protein